LKPKIKQMKNTLLQLLRKASRFIFCLLLIACFSNNSKAQCAASFTWSQGINGTINFVSTSTGTSLSSYYNWNYGDGNTGGGQNPSHTYGNNGVYNVILTMYSSTVSPCTSSVVQTVTVTTSPCSLPLNANFTYSVGTGGVASFTSLSTGTTLSTTYNWWFGDGGTSTQTNPVHTYSANGSYPVFLSLNDGTCNDSIYMSVLVTTVPCTLTASFNYTQGLNGSVNFASTSTGTNINTVYNWSYGDGFNGWGANPTHTYGVNGVYQVTLTAMNSTVGPCSSSVVQSVTVTTSPCSIPLNANFSYTTGTAGTASFTSLSTNTTISTTYAWNFGDGGTSPAINPVHTYTSNANYPVLLVLTDGACVDSISQYISITNAPCLLTASFNYTSGLNGQVNFVSTSTGTNNFSSYNWGFGDTYVGWGANQFHNYLVNGIYSVTLTVTNGTTNVCTSTVVQNVTITTAPCSTPVVASFNYTVGTGGVVNFESTSTGTNLSSTYFWSYGDGAAGTGSVSVHTYSNGGLHNVYFAVNNAPACSDSTMMTINVNSIPCVANSNFTLAYSGTPQYWYAVPAYPWNVTAAIWSWGDGNFDYNLYSAHTYSAAGLYNICLTVTTSCGTSSTCSGYNIYKSSMPVEISQAMIQVNVVAKIPTGIKQNAEDKATVNVYPNPNDGKINIRIEHVSGSVKSALIEVYDLLGKSVHSEQVAADSGNINALLSLEALPNGSYYIKIKTGQKTYMGRTVINK
jgi:PKD repeat protein